MKRVSLFLALSVFILKADSLEAVLNRMDEAARTFRSLTSDVHHTDYSDLFSETNTEEGKFKMAKKPKGGLILLAEFTGRDPRQIYIGDSKLQVYHPKANSVDIYDTRKFTKPAEVLIMVGFGTPRAELEKRFRISFGGSETVAGVKTTRIDLKPKSAEDKNFFNEIRLWIPEDKGNPIQEKVLSGKEGKDYDLLLYSNLKINPQLPQKEFELKLPAGVKSIPAGK
ncbi:MAG TPA: hypothetical protein VMT15_09310 [Bryobacteraceae bacterium]|nr:hypothetical protein [Bryobacteraceae bacterium]